MSVQIGIMRIAFWWNIAMCRGQWFLKATLSWKCIWMILWILTNGRLSGFVHRWNGIHHAKLSGPKVLDFCSGDRRISCGPQRINNAYWMRCHVLEKVQPLHRETDQFPSEYIQYTKVPLSQRHWVQNVELKRSFFYFFFFFCLFASLNRVCDCPGRVVLSVVPPTKRTCAL